MHRRRTGHGGRRRARGIGTGGRWPIMVVSGYWPSQAPYEELPLPELLRRSAERFGDKPALIAADGATRTYGELWSHARKVARLLQDHGIEKGDRVGIFSPNHVDYAAVFYGSPPGRRHGHHPQPPLPGARDRAPAGRRRGGRPLRLQPHGRAGGGGPPQPPPPAPRLAHGRAVGIGERRPGGLPAGAHQPPRGRGRAALLQRHHGPPQGRHAHPLQHLLQRQAEPGGQEPDVGHGQPVRAALLPHLRDDGAPGRGPRSGRHRHRDDAVRRGADAASRREAQDDQPLPGAAGSPGHGQRPGSLSLRHLLRAGDSLRRGAPGPGGRGASASRSTAALCRRATA